MDQNDPLIERTSETIAKKAHGGTVANQHAQMDQNDPSAERTQKGNANATKQMDQNDPVVLRTWRGQKIKWSF